MAKDKLAQEQAKATADAAAAQAAAEQAEQALIAAVPFTCAACQAVSESGDRLKGCNACRKSLGEQSAEWPRYFNKGWLPEG